ncbi:MAG: 2TM domain-containing protein [Flavobacterium sp.]
MKRHERERMFENLNRESGITNEEYYLAYKRVKRIKGFYTHFIVYVFVNLYLIFDKCYDANSFASLNNLHTYSTAFFWGIGLVAHGLSVFGSELFFGNNWEQKKIRQYMERDKKTNFQ